RTRCEHESFPVPADIHAFASELTKVLVELSSDQHLLVRARPTVGESAPDEPLHPLHDRMLRRSHHRTRNFGFEKLERMADNIGYLDLRYFASPWDAQPT